MSLSEEQLSAATDFLKSLDVTGLLQAAAMEAETINQNSRAADLGLSAGATSPLELLLQGLESMHDVEKTSILYAAPIDTTERLYPFCLALQKAFQKQSFVFDDDRTLKLHATIVNTIFAKGRQLPATIVASGPSDNRSLGHGRNANAPLKIDASSMLKKFKDYVWAESITLDRIAICEMGAKKMPEAVGNLAEEKYTEVATVSLPA